LIGRLECSDLNLKHYQNYLEAKAYLPYNLTWLDEAEALPNLVRRSEFADACVSSWLLGY